MKKKFVRFSIIAVVLGAILCSWSYFYIQSYSAKYLYNSVEDVPAHKVGLVLGTSPTLSNGTENLFFKYRIQTAAALYKTGKVKYLLVSGDNSRNDYNEAEAMRLALMELGVPDAAIIKDYAGLRTLDSILRCRDIFGQQDYIVISQPFHNERAIFIARKHGIAAVGLNATDITGRYAIRTRLREVLARVNTVLDIYILHKTPKFGGEKIPLP